MSNQASLYAGHTPSLTNPDDPLTLDPQDGAFFIAGAACTIPAFWLFCFAPEDFVTVNMDEEGELDTFVAEKELACRRLGERDGLARERFPAHTDLWERWRRVVSAVPRRYIKLDPVEVWAMFEDETELAAWMCAAVDWFQFGREDDFRALLRLAGIRAYDPATRTFPVEPQACPEKYLYGWLERDALSLVSAGPAAGADPPRTSGPSPA